MSLSAVVRDQGLDEVRLIKQISSTSPSPCVHDAYDLFGETAGYFVIFCSGYGDFGSLYDELCARDNDFIVVTASRQNGAVERDAAASAGGRRCGGDLHRRL
eukprot:5700798-Heterocapsa_arctica.AAC.1